MKALACQLLANVGSALGLRIDFAAIADMILYDAKPPRGAALPGGNGVVFDWQALKNVARDPPFMLSGGLNADTV